MMTKPTGGRIPAKEHKKLKLEDAVDYALDRLVFAAPVSGVSSKQANSAGSFLPRGKWPVWLNLDGYGDETLIHAPRLVDDPLLVWPLCVGLAGGFVETGFGPTMDATWWKSVPASVLRGKCRLSGRFNIEVAYGRFIERNEFLSVTDYATWTGAKWTDSQFLRQDGRAFRPGASELDAGTRAGLGQSFALTVRYEWGVCFSLPGTSGVIVNVGAEAIKSLFDDRNKPAYVDRRSALRHWVRQHHRKTRGGDFIGVREYLRGEEQFNWRGFDVTVLPSQFDREKNKEATSD